MDACKKLIDCLEVQADRDGAKLIPSQIRTANDRLGLPSNFALHTEGVHTWVNVLAFVPLLIVRVQELSSRVKYLEEHQARLGADVSHFEEANARLVLENNAIRVAQSAQFVDCAEIRGQYKLVNERLSSIEAHLSRASVTTDAELSRVNNILNIFRDFTMVEAGGALTDETGKPLAEAEVEQKI